MDFIKIVTKLLHSDQISEKRKQRRIERFAEVLTSRNSHPVAPGNLIAKEPDLQLLKNFFILIKKYLPQELGPVLTVTSENNWTMGHEVARHKNEQGLNFFLDHVHTELPAEFKNILRAKTVNGWNMGHLIARFQKGPELKAFFKSVLAYCPELLPELIDARLDDGRQIAHLIAQFQDPDVVDYFLNMLGEYDKQYNTNLRVNVLAPSLRSDWHIGFFIAERKDHRESVINYLNQLQQFAPKELSRILEATTTEGWHLGHLIAEHQDEKTLDYYLSFTIKHAPDTLASILNAREQGPRLLGILILNHKKHLGPIVFHLISSAIPLGNAMYERLKEFRYSVLEHISRLPAKDQIILLDECLDHKKPLGLYFDIPQGILSSHFGENHEYRDYIKNLRVKAEVAAQAQQSIKVSETQGQRFFDKDAHITPLADPCDYTYS